MLKHKRQEETQCYTNDLHDALMPKSGTKFWKCWNSKFEKGNKCCKYIDGMADDVQIAEAFAEHFRKTSTSLNEVQNSHLKFQYADRRKDYVGDPLTDTYIFDAELVEAVCCKMKLGKAAGLDELTVEHIINSHPVLISILARLFTLIIFVSHVPYKFRLSYMYTVGLTLPKEDNIYKRNTVDNYRAIFISPVISKVFEHCVLTKFSKFFNTSPTFHHVCLAFSLMT